MQVITYDKRMCANKEDSLFFSFLEEMHKNFMYVDVPRIKREQALVALNVVKNSLETKDTLTPFYLLTDLYCKLNSGDSDEYQLDTVETDIVGFSVGIISLLVKHYNQAELMIRNLMVKYHHPVLFYIFALIRQYQYSFKDAITLMQKSVDLLVSYKDETLVWPGTNVLIISIDKNLLKTNILCNIEEMMKVKDISYNVNIPSFDKNEFSLEMNHGDIAQTCTKTLGTLIKYDLYDLIRLYVDDLIQFDRGNYFKDWKNNVKSISLGQVTESSSQLEKKSKEVSSKPIKKNNISVKNQFTQTKIPTKNIVTQTGFKMISRFTQTNQVDAVTVDNKKEIKHKKKLDASLAERKKTAETNIILEAEIKKLKSELEVANQTIGQLKKKSHQCEFVIIPKLQDHINYMHKMQQEIKDENNKKEVLYKDLLLKEFKNSFQVQQTAHKEFETQCREIIASLQSIKNDLNTSSVPTVNECDNHLAEYEKSLEKCLNDQKECSNYYTTVENLIIYNSFDELENIKCAPLPNQKIINPVHEYFPILVVSLIDCQNKLKERIEVICEKMSSHQQEEAANNIEEKEITNQIAATSSITKPNQQKILNSSIMLSEIPSISTSRNLSPSVALKSTSSNFESNKKMQALCSHLKSKIPEKTEAEIMAALQTFRKQNNGKLSGMTVHYILFNVYKILYSLESAWAVVESNFPHDWEGSKDNSCSICLDLFQESPTVTLKCKHKFHSTCIRSWLTKNSICAICRVYVTLDEDFPPLH